MSVLVKREVGCRPAGRFRSLRSHFVRPAAPRRPRVLPSKVDVRADNDRFLSLHEPDAARGRRSRGATDGGRRTIEGDAMRWDLQEKSAHRDRQRCASSGDRPKSTASPTSAISRTATPTSCASTRPGDLRRPRRRHELGDRRAGARGNVRRGRPRRPAAVHAFARHAVVTPNGAVRMAPVEFPTGAGPALKLPTYLYTLVQNQYIAHSAAPCASFDQPYSLFGSPASLTAAHLRYDSQPTGHRGDRRAPRRSRTRRTSSRPYCRSATSSSTCSRTT
jgi:hypothetical protein